MPSTLDAWLRWHQSFWPELVDEPARCRWDGHALVLDEHDRRTVILERIDADAASIEPPLRYVREQAKEATLWRPIDLETAALADMPTSCRRSWERREPRTERGQRARRRERWLAWLDRKVSEGMTAEAVWQIYRQQADRRRAASSLNEKGHHHERPDDEPV